jgi:hypothetical protein
MPKIRLPDGRLLNVPDDISPEDKARLRAKLVEKFPEEFREKTFGGQALETAKAIPRGFISGLSSAVEGIGELVGLEGLAESQRDFQQSLRESDLLGADKLYEDTYASKLGEGLGSFASFFVPSTLAAKSVGAIGKGGKALSQAERAKAGAKRATYTAAGIAAPIGVAEQTDRIREAEGLGEEVSFVQKKIAQTLGLGIGLTELYPAERLFKVLRKIPKSRSQELRATDKILSALKTGGMEGAQEAGAQLLQDATARNIYSDKIPIGESLLDEFTVGAGVGFIADLAVRGRGRPATGTVEEIKQEEKLRESMDVKLKSASETKQKLLEQGSPSINPNNVVSEEQIALEEEYIPEDVKPAESVKLMPSPDGSVNIVGSISGNLYGNTTQDKAGQEAAKIEDQIRSESTSTLVNDLNFINGNSFNGTAFFIGQKIHNPYSTQVAIDQISNQDTNLKTFKNETKAQAMRRKMKRKKVNPAKSYVSFAETKKLLSPKDFNNLMINRSQAQEQTNVLDLKRKPLTIEKGGKVSISKPTFNKLLQEKNIDTSLTSPEFEFFLEQTTGAKTFASANKGQKQVALAKIQSFPKFKRLTPLPNYKPRSYNGRQLQEFVRNYKEIGQSKPITKAAIKKYLPRLNTQGVNDFFNDLQTSGRVVDKQINNNFYNEQVQKAEPYNETAQEFADRLRSYGATDSQINENINSVQIEEQQAEQQEQQTEVLALAPPIEQQFEDIRTNVRKYLDERGLSDVGLRFSKGLESATNLQRDSEGNYSFKQNLTDPGIYDQASKEIIINLNALPKQATDIQIQEHITETVNHEIIHAIRDLDLITEREYTDLLTYAKRILPARKETKNIIRRVQTEYADQSDAVINEEIVAELFREYKLRPDKIAPKPRGILAKINAFLEGITRAFSKSGIVNTADLLQAIDSGKIGSRQRGVLRSLRETVRDSSQVPVLAQRNALVTESRKLLNVIKNNPEGFTIDAKTGESITEGFPVAPVKEAEYVIDADNLTEDMVDEYAIILHRMSQSTNKPIRAGGWLNSRDNKYYLDAVIVMDNLADALYYAQAGKQEAVFNLNTFEEIDTNEGIKQLKESGDFSSEQRNVIRRDSQNIKRVFRNSRLRNQAIQEVKQVTVKEYEEAVQNKESLEEQNAQLERGRVPKYNTDADPVTLKIATDVADNKVQPKEDQDIPILKRVQNNNKVIPNKYKSLEKSIGQVNHGEDSSGMSLLKLMEPYRDGLKKWATEFRKKYVFKLANIEKGIKEAQRRNPDLIAKENWTETGTIQQFILSDRSTGVFQQMLLYGKPNLDLGITTVDSSGGIFQIFDPLMAETVDENGRAIDKLALYKMYSIGRKSKRLDDNGIEVPVTPEEIELSQEIAKDFPDVAEAYENFQDYNASVIDYAVEGGILQERVTTDQLINEYNNKAKDPYAVDLSKGEKQIRTEILDLIETYNRKQKEVKDKIETRGTAQIWRDNADYYPFYREMVEGNLNAPKIASGYLGGNPFGIPLKGSKEDITPNPIDAISRNYISIVTAVNKNIGVQRLTDSYVRANMAEEITNPKLQKGIDVYPVFIDGQKRYFRVEDPELIDGLQTVGIDELTPLMKFVGIPAGWLRELVTRDPTFMVRNSLRDTLSVAITSGANMVPFVETFKAIGEDVTKLERAAVIGGYDLGRDERGVKKLYEKRTEKRNLLNPLDATVKLWDGLEQGTYKSDYITRKAVYNRVLEATGSEAEALFQALEVINFNRRGDDPLFRVVTAGIPFLNARIQGLDVLYRSATGKYSAIGKPAEGQSQADFEREISRRMITRLGFLTLLTGLYYLLVSDDEQYRGLSREERDNYWNFFVGGERITIPIPFEVGVIAKVVPERTLDLAFGEDNARDFAESMIRNAKGTLKVDLLGFQVLKPLLEVANNKSTYFGTEIVPTYMTKLPPELQYNQSTSEFSKILGDALNISPLKLDYVLRGYGGTIGTYVLSSMDAVLKETVGTGFIPPRIDQLPVFSAFMRNPQSGGYVQQFYELKRFTDQYVQAVNKLKEEGRIKELELYMKANRGLAQTRGRVRAIERYLKNWRERRDRILYSDISGARKKELIEELIAERDDRLLVVPELRDNADIPLPAISDVVFDFLGADRL